MATYEFESVSEDQFKEMQVFLREVGGYKPKHGPFKSEPQGRKMVSFSFGRQQDNRKIELSFWYDHEKEKTISGLVGNNYDDGSEDRLDELLRVISSRTKIKFSPLEESV